MLYQITFHEQRNQTASYLMVNALDIVASVTLQ